MNQLAMPLLKPLYANLLRVGIGEYLISDSFNHLCIELNLDQLWEQCDQYVTHQSEVLVVVPGYTGYVEEALGLFLNSIYDKGRDFFVKTLERILEDFKNWSKQKKDFKDIEKSLISLGFKESEFSAIAEKQEEFEIVAQSKEKHEHKIEIPIEKNLCFVLMPFNESFNPIYSNIIKEIVTTFDINCVRADEIFGTRPIMKDIEEYIRKARFLIADLTDRNPNVFYELGFAHALDKKVILITQKIEDVPFDLKHYRIIVYQNSIAGASNLEKGLKSTIEQTLEETKS